MTQREHWGSKLGIILAAAGSAVGLGAIWKLPYIMGQNGGGAFILMFLLFNFLIGVPLFMGELLIGRKSQRSVVGAFTHFAGEDSSWKMVGWIAVTAAILIAGWYCVVAGWGINYFLMSLSDSFKGLTAPQIGIAFDTFRRSGDLNILWQVIFLAANFGVLVSGVNKGVEFWSRIINTWLFIVLLGLGIYSCTLSGFGQAVEYVLYPNFSLVTATSVLKALGLALFTLSLGYGIMITYGSYMRPTDDIPKTAIIVGVANLVCSVMIALMIFPMIFTFGIPPQDGEGLIFKALPFVFEQLPGSIIISVLFFALLTFAGLTSSMSMIEVAVANFMDLKQWSRQKSLAITIAMVFVLGLPTAMSGTGSVFPNWQSIFGLDFLATNDMLSDWMLSSVALCSAIFIGWRLDKSMLKEAFCEGSNWGRLFRPWLFLIRWIVPIGILLVIGQRARLINLEALIGSWRM